MGTHPIFESDFDCLTEMNRLAAGSARLSLRLGQRQILSQTSKRTAFDMGPMSCGYRWSAYADPALSIFAQSVFGIFWVYYLYHCWNHSEHHLCQAGFPNPIGEATELVTGHYVGYKGTGALSARMEILNEELGLPPAEQAAPSSEDEEEEATPMGAMLKK